MILNKKKEAALAYLERGFSVIPIGRDKKPLIKWEQYQKKAPTKDEIEEWFKHFSDANIGIVTGSVSGIVVVDVEKGGRTDDLPSSVVSKTGGGGFHYYYKHPGITVKNGVRIGNKEDKRDIRGDGGYVVAPPSLHASGEHYEWITPPESVAGFADFPMWLVENKSTTVGGIKSSAEVDWATLLGGVGEGERNATAARVAGKTIVRLPEKDWETFGWQTLCGWNMKNRPPMNEGELRAVWESICELEKTRRAKKGDGDEKKNYSELIVELITSNPNIVLFHDDSGEPFVRISTNGHFESWPCKAKSFKRWLAKSFYDAHKKSAPSNSMRDALSTIEGMACFGGKEFPLYNRVALIDGTLWYDLTDDKWRAVKMDTKGWQIVLNPPILFRRYSHQRPQIEPAATGDIKNLLQFVNIASDQQKLLLLVYIVSCFIPEFPHPIPFIYGSQGSAKSVLSKIIRRLIDPSLTEVLNLPRDGSQFAQMLSHHWYLFFDNVSELLEWQSDLLCKAVTGDGFSKRELYSDDDDIIYAFKRCIGINGVNLVVSKPDLLERTIPLELERVSESKRLQESELWKRFEAERPIILAGIFTALSKAMKIQPTVSGENLPRMADFTVWGCAIAEAIGYTQQQFLDAYRANIKSQNEVVLFESHIATTVIKFMEDKLEWEDTPSQLLKELTTVAETMRINTEKEKEWPKAANVLSRKLNELKTNLAEDGILVSRGDKNKERIITLKKTSEDTVAIVEPSPSESAAIRRGDDTGSDTTQLLPPLYPEKQPNFFGFHDRNDSDDISRLS